SFGDLIPRNLPVVGFGDAFVFDRALIARPQKAKLDPLRFGRSRVKAYWNIDEAEADSAFPNGSWHDDLLLLPSLSCRTIVGSSNGGYSQAADPICKRLERRTLRGADCE